MKYEDNHYHAMNRSGDKNGNPLPPEEVQRAKRLEDDPEAILRLVDLIFFYVDEKPAILS